MKRNDTKEIAEEKINQKKKIVNRKSRWKE